MSGLESYRRQLQQSLHNRQKAECEGRLQERLHEEWKRERAQLIMSGFQLVTDYSSDVFREINQEVLRNRGKLLVRPMEFVPEGTEVNDRGGGNYTVPAYYYRDVVLETGLGFYVDLRITSPHWVPSLIGVYLDSHTLVRKSLLSKKERKSLLSGGGINVDPENIDEGEFKDELARRSGKLIVDVAGKI